MAKPRQIPDRQLASVGNVPDQDIQAPRRKYPAQWAGVIELETASGGALVPLASYFPLNPFSNWAAYRATIEELRRGRPHLKVAGLIIQTEIDVEANDEDLAAESVEDDLGISPHRLLRCGRHAARAVLQAARALPNGVSTDGLTVSFADGWATLRLFADRASTEAWLRSTMPALVPLEKKGEMVGEREGLGEGKHALRPRSDRVDFATLRHRLTESFDRSRVQIASEFEQPLNDEATSRPHESYEEKKELAKWVNAELRRFGLALKCPKTGRPAILIGHATGVPGVGRFHIEVLGEEGVAKRTYTGVQLPTLELTLADLTWAKGSAARGRE
jgi:hypothetical protein